MKSETRNNKQLREQLSASWELLSRTEERHKRKIRQVAQAYRRMSRTIGGNRVINKILLKQNRDLRQRIKEFHHGERQGN